MVAGVVTVLTLVAVVAGWVFGGRTPTGTGAASKSVGGTAAVAVAVPTVLILDASGSMTEADAPGPRIDAAKAAARALLDALPDDARLGLETYGTGTGSTDGEHDVGCRDVHTLIALGPLNRDQMRAQIDGLRPSGYTPIGLALQRAAAQLPADDSAQAIVLVSDGEDTCESTPCETAAQLKASHRNLTISTVGFKTDGMASDQLRCIANATGGLFVEATNASQLGARLIATQNLGQAQTALTSTGIGDIQLGQSLADIRQAHNDFPDANTTGRVTAVWRDCDYGFTDGTLDSIAPHDGGHTIDGLTPGTDVSRAMELYGSPLNAEANSDGSHTVVFDGASNADAAYRMVVDHYTRAGQVITGAIKSIVLCRCKGPSGKWTDSVIVITPKSLGAVRLGMSIPQAEAAAGGAIESVGDGVYRLRGTGLYFQPGASGVECVGAEADPHRTVTTPEGVRVGDEAGRVADAYGDRAQYLPAPTGGRTPAEGYVVKAADGTLAFVVHDNVVIGIHAGSDVTPSNCGG